MTNPPPFQIPDDNERPEAQAPAANTGQPQWYPPDAQQYGPPLGEPQQFTPPYGQPAPYAPQQQQQYAPPPSVQAPQSQQYQDPQQQYGGQQYGQQQYGQPSYGQQQYGGDPQQQFASAAPPQSPSGPSSGPGSAQPPYVPPQAQADQPQWSGGGAAAAAGPGVSPMPPPTGPSSGPRSSPQFGSPSAAYPNAPQPGAYQAGHSGPPVRNGRDILLGPPSAHRPRKPKRSLLIPMAVVSLALGAWTLPGAVKEAKEDTTGGLGQSLAKGEVAWSIRDGRDGPEPDVNADSSVRPGAWFSGDNIVITESNRLVAYNMDTGKTDWEYKGPDGTVVCAAGPQVADAPALVAFGDAEKCTSIEAIDVASGQKLWSADLTGDGNGSSTISLMGDSSIEVADNVAVIDGEAFDIAGGAPLWTVGDNLPSGCSSPKVTGGAALVVTATCRSATNVMQLDLATGRPAWTHKVEGDGGFGNQVSVVSTSPVALKAGSTLGSSTKPPSITVLDDRGEVAYTITEGGPMVSAGDALVGTSDFGMPLLASDKIVYVPGAESGSKAMGMELAAMTADQISAFDRKTGTKLWTMKVDTGMKLGVAKIDLKGAIYPLRVEESGDLLALVTGGSGSFKPMHLVRLSAADGSFTNLKEIPTRVSFAKTYLSEKKQVFEKDGRIFFVGMGKNPEGVEQQRLNEVMPSSVDSILDQRNYRVIAVN